MFWQTLGWFGSWLGVIGCGVWACLEVLVKALAVAWLYSKFRDGEKEEQDGALIEPSVSGEGPAPAEQREPQRTAPEDCRV